MPTLLPLAIVAVLVATPGSALAEPDVRALLAAAVQARMGAVSVRVEGLRVRLSGGDAPRTAVADAGSRVGGAMRFVLMAPDAAGRARRVGSADAQVFIEARHARATRRVARGQALTAGDYVTVTGDPGRVALYPLPDPETLRDAVARQDLREGMLLSRHVLSVAALVRSGEDVTTVIRTGALEVRGRAVALENGALGGRVRVIVNRRSLRGRVIGAGSVEVLP